MPCRKWSLPEGTYFTGLCSMEMLPETANPTKSCGLCLSPVDVSVSGCGCEPPLKLRSIHYMRIGFADSFTPGPPPYSPCWINGILGDFVMLGTCSGYSTAYRVTFNPSFNRPPSFTLPECFVGSGDLVPRFWWRSLGVFPAVQPDGTYRMAIEVSFNLRSIIWQGPYYPEPDYEIEQPVKFSGLIPWCIHSRGSGLLGQMDTGLFGPMFKCTFSTGPF
jgi:hypothetical protein